MVFQNNINNGDIIICITGIDFDNDPWILLNQTYRYKVSQVLNSKKESVVFAGSVEFLTPM